ncbi:MAG: DUF3108 domain-containing protein [Gammaproteobacteria bacterium]|jgi:hypothetical protein|nr:DUF3108 domain-containing protein [Gammaproteobacteria bacterium]MBT3724790.1 DUF3108 domain-containing protein [Gammaproteobacteria bacterium]MBT4075252.1 DUF3108 domain-containing protein [Gammaproteobacteria bacterium]MBT4194507.1 DUF3108 domain-containing protein [Gammaproteobacteria bacterium]MBT4449744.1 DUF3108 domain-containing protein [Gammaproteobacteria bacterium]
MHFNFHHFLLIALLLAGFNVQALELNPFNARYHVYRGNTHVAISKFSLKKQKSEWVWRMKTGPRGIYSWLTRKKPFAETRMQETGRDIQLLLETTGDYPKKPAKQSTWFDHVNNKIYSMKGKNISQLKLPENTYNYHSVHLLHPLMLENNEQKMDINFYKRGELLKSTVTLEKQIELPAKKGKTIVDKLTQTFKGSSKKMVYYYKGKTLAPLKIEQIKPGKDKSVMWRIDS